MSTDEGVDLSAMLRALWRRKWLIVVLTLLGAALAWLAVSRIEPRYTARSAVMLDPRSVQVLDNVDVVSDLTLSNPVLDSEVTVLRSNLLLQDVLAGFEPDALAALDPALEPPSLLGRTVGAISGLLSAPPPADGASGMQAGLDASEMMSPEERRIRRLTGALRRAMTVWREGQSYVISISVETEDPVLSMRLANGIAGAYIDRQVEQRRAAVRGANDFLEERVATMRGEVEAAEAAVEDFRREQLAVGGASPESLDRQLIDLSTQIAVASADLATAEARARQIRSVVEDAGLATAAELLSSPFVVSLREDLSELEREQQELAARLGPEHPDRVRVRNAIASVAETLEQEVTQIIATLENEVSVAAIREQSLRDSLSSLESRSADLTRASLALRQLEREAEAVRGSYEAALIRASETQSIEELQRADALIIERASIPGAPSAPRVMLFTALGGTGGFGLGLMLATLLSVFGHGFARASELEQATGLPVATTLPLGRWRNVRRMLELLTRMPYQPYAEQVRQLRAALVADNDPCSVLVASSVPGEGKTTLSVAFARIEAMSRRSCLLLDFDMRKSNLARELDYDPEGGDLADMFYGRCDLDAAICHSPDRGFDLLTVRKAVPHLFDQVSADSLRELLETLTQRYDRVIVDSAPILAVADTLPLVPHVDATVLLVRSHRTNRRAVAETIWRLRNMGANPLNLVFSMAESRDGGDSYGAGGSYLDK
jgi:uncharacterized protein involved in exopolysaccharide biosynthesis